MPGNAKNAVGARPVMSWQPTDVEKMPENPEARPFRVTLSGFADEVSARKTALEQFSVFAALGLQYYTIRFVDLGTGIKNVMQLNRAEIATLKSMQSEFGLQVASMGSPIGKIKLCDIEDGTKTRFVAFDNYLDEIRLAIQRAHELDTQLLRGFSFYPPRGESPVPYLAEVVQRMGKIAELCEAAGIVFGVEVEANLVGCTGRLLAELHAKVGSPHLKLIFDAANLLSQGFSAEQTFYEYQAMKPGLGWMHVKDYIPSRTAPNRGYIDEDSLHQFVPVSPGSGVYHAVLCDLRDELPQRTCAAPVAGSTGFLLDLEPHLKAGGQFGGVSGPDGMGVALRALCHLLNELAIGYELRNDWRTQT